MRIIPMIAMLAIVLWSLPVAAQHIPGTWRVVDVASDDTLNVRAGPSASTTDIGDLPHDARGVEVIETNAAGTWGRIVWEEANGWISMRFLAPDPLPGVGESALPAGLLCGGTEPFWSLRLSASGAVYDDIEMVTHITSVISTIIAGGRPDFPVSIGLSGPTSNANAMIRPAMCSDGMSDRDYGWSIDLLLATALGTQYLLGCCHLPLDAGSH